MNYTLDSLSALVKLPMSDMDSQNDMSENVTNQAFNTLVSGAFQKLSETDMHYKDMINSISNSPSCSDSEALMRLQSYLGEYSNYVTLVTTIARKGVGTIETLEKSQ